MPLYSYQRKAVRKLLRLDGVGLLSMEMGTGKTRVALEIARRQNASRILVVVPLSAVGVWENEIAAYSPEAVAIDCTQGAVRRRAQTLSESTDAGKPAYCIVGYESMWRDPLRSAILKWSPETVIYDEGHRLKARTTRQSKFAHRLRDTVPHRLALTGTPMPNGIEDLFSLFKALEASVFGTRWVEFEWRFLRMGGYGGYQIIGYRNLGLAQDLVEKHSYRITKLEALDLPEQVDVQVPINLAPKERRAYDELRTRAIAEVEGLSEGKPARGTALSRVIVTNIMRLQQVTSGFVKVTDGRIIELGRSKLTALRDLLSDAIPQAKRVVVFCRFIHDVEAVSEAVRKMKVPVWRLDGSIPRKRRAESLKEFQTCDEGVLVGQIAVSSLAIDLTCAHIAVFFSPDYSYTNYAQSRDRLHRIGQRNPVTYYHLVVPQSVDDRVYRALQAKRDISRTVLDVRRARVLFS